MPSFFSKLKSAPFLAVMAMTVLFLITLLLGVRQGQAVAQAKSVDATAQALGKGLDYFFSDQNRFPTAQEFEDKNILLLYFSGLPDKVSVNATCSENFIYKRLQADSYELDFCLATGIGSHNKGWNKLSIQK